MRQSVAQKLVEHGRLKSKERWGAELVVVVTWHNSSIAE